MKLFKIRNRYLWWKFRLFCFLSPNYKKKMREGFDKRERENKRLMEAITKVIEEKLKK